MRKEFERFSKSHPLSNPIVIEISSLYNLILILFNLLLFQKVFDGQNLLDLPNTTVNIYERHVSRVLWKNHELETHRLEVYEKKKTGRVIFFKQEDLDKIELLKSIFILFTLIYHKFNSQLYF